MMFNCFLLLFLLKTSISFEFNSNNYGEKFDRVKVNNQDLYHTKSVKDSSKWLIFPLQLNYHDSSLKKSASFEINKNALRQQDDLIDSTLVVHHEDNSFWKEYHKYLNLHEDVEMKLSKESFKKSFTMKEKLFDQFIYGFQVFGGDYKVTIGAHDGITHMHGHSFPRIDKSYDYIRSISDLPENSIKEKDLLTILVKVDGSDIAVEQNLLDNYEVIDQFEMLWLENTSSELILVYHVKVNDIMNHKAFDAFIDFTTLEVVSVMQNPLLFSSSASSSSSNSNVNEDSNSLMKPEQLLQAVENSPFTSKSFNSIVALLDATVSFKQPVFMSNTSTYPTKSNDENILIDTTLYTQNLIYSLSNSEYITWEKIQRTLAILYNEPGANAFFDSKAKGIRFSAGLICKDIVGHEWFHGYTQTVNKLVYAFQSGSMNEAFSDIIGESIDILTSSKTSNLNKMRSVEPSSCTQGFPSTTVGSDKGARWIIGQDLNPDVVQDNYRDMYKPECFNTAGHFYSPYYVCTAGSTTVNGGDFGGVHSNSAVLSHFYAVMVDGGIIRDGVKPVRGLGFMKSLNLFWNTIQELTSLSQFQDFAVALSMTCENMIGEPIYNLNYLDFKITAAASISELITAKDCRMLDTLIKQSQINQKQPKCPNLVCGDSLTTCKYLQCAASTGDLSIAHEEYSPTTITAVPSLCGSSGPQSVARVFNQSLVNTKDFYLSCIEFSISSIGLNDVTISVYIDKTGGFPDAESFQLVKSKIISSPNSKNLADYMILTTSDESVTKIQFENEIETLVVVMEYQITSNISRVTPFGHANDKFNSYLANNADSSIPSDLFTYVTAPCMKGIYSSVYSHHGTPLMSSDITQWYVRLTGSSTNNHQHRNHSNDDDSISKQDIAGIVIGCFFFVVLLGILAYFAYRLLSNTNQSGSNIRKENKSEVNESNNNNEHEEVSPEEQVQAVQSDNNTMV